MATHNYSQSEMMNIIKTGIEMSAKPVLEAASLNLREHGYADLAERVMGMCPVKNTGYMSCTIDEVDLVLNISLCVVKKDYKSSISIPHEKYANDLFANFNALKQMATAYWLQFQNDNADLVKEIHNIDPNCALVVDEANPTTMYFGRDYPYRVGIFCYYTDPKTGQHYVNKNKFE
jgi:hypothetical protein